MGIQGRASRLVTMCAMRRLFALFLLLLMPFQFGWAAVAAYCGHESTPTACYFGHHDHQHRDGGSTASATQLPAGSADQIEASLVSLDSDCSQCHFSVLKVLATADVSGRPDADRQALTSHQPFLASRALDRIERPKWPLA